MYLPLSTSTVAGFFLPLAHQGGWDEILLVAAPLAIVGLLLYVANRRVNAQLAQAGDTAGSTSDPDTTTAAGSETATDGSDNAESEDSSA